MINFIEINEVKYPLLFKSTPKSNRFKGEISSLFELRQNANSLSSISSVNNFRNFPIEAAKKLGFSVNDRNQAFNIVQSYVSYNNDALEFINFLDSCISLRSQENISDFNYFDILNYLVGKSHFCNVRLEYINGNIFAIVQNDDNEDIETRIDIIANDEKYEKVFISYLERLF